MGQLREMTERELMAELAEVELAIRTARMPAPVPASLPPGITADGWEDLAVSRPAKIIVAELRQRRVTPLTSCGGERKNAGCASHGRASIESLPLVSGSQETWKTPGQVRSGVLPVWER